MITVDNLTKYFGRVAAIRNMSFDVEKREIVGFLGPNGAGKSTTMRIITCFFPPTSGSVNVAGYDSYTDSLNIRRKIGYLPENAPLYEDMTALSYLKFVSDVRGFSKAESKKKIAKVMDECNISDVSQKLIKNLSKGYKQRVGLAQAFLHDPEVLILDEPTIGLDPKQLIEIRQLINNAASKRTVLLSSHILHEVSLISDRVIIINKGQILAVDTPKNLMNKLQKNSHIIVKVEGPSEQILSGLKMIPGVFKVKELSADSHQVCSFQIESKKDPNIIKNISGVIFRNNWGLLELTHKNMDLEEIFLNVIKNGVI